MGMDAKNTLRTHFLKSIVFQTLAAALAAAPAVATQPPTQISGCFEILAGDGKLSIESLGPNRLVWPMSPLHFPSAKVQTGELIFVPSQTVIDLYENDGLTVSDVSQLIRGAVTIGINNYGEFPTELVFNISASKRLHMVIEMSDIGGNGFQWTAWDIYLSPTEIK